MVSFEMLTCFLISDWLRSPCRESRIEKISSSSAGSLTKLVFFNLILLNVF